MKFSIYILFFLLAFVSCKNSSQENLKIIIDKNLSLAENENFSKKERAKFNTNAFLNLCALSNDSLHRAQLFKIIVNYNDIGHFDKFKEAIDTVYKRSIASNNIFDISRSYKCLGYFHWNKKNYDSSYFYYLQAKKLYLKNNDYDNLSRCYFKIASIQFDVFDYSNSEQSAIRALRYSRISKSKDAEYCALVLLAIISNRMNNFSESLERHLEAFELIEKYNLNINYYYECSLNNIGGVYQGLNRDHKAIEIFNQALSNKNIFQGDPELYSTLIDNLAYSKLKVGKHKNIENLLIKALYIREELNLSAQIVLSYNHLSEFKRVTGNKLAAITFAEKALFTATKVNSPIDILQSLKQLILVDPENAKKYSQQYIRLSDSLQLAERKMRNKFARIAYETEEITIEKDEAIKQKGIMFWSSVGLLLLGALIFIIRNQKARQKELMFVQQQQKSNLAIHHLIHDRKSKIDEARQVEKKRIARELHDGVMNRLTGIRLNLFILTKKQDPQTIEKCLNYIGGLQDVEKEIRQVAHDLNNDIFSGNKSYNDMLETLFSEQRTISNFDFHSDIDNTINWEAIESALKINLYRILQEVLQNCNKYAQAENVHVTIVKENQLLDVIVQDDGIGFNIKKKKSGIGLRNIADRVSELSGKINITSDSVTGTKIHISIPIDKADADES